MIRVRQIKIEVSIDNVEQLYIEVAKKLNINKSNIKELKIYRKSIDARNKEEIYYVYEVNVLVDSENKLLKYNKSKDIFLADNQEYKYKISGGTKLKNSPVIVGSGPAGLFCAYFLALNNYNPIIIERGEDIDNRIKSVEKFWETNILNENSNVQFGLGGAGTFSDGKLNTLVKDKNNRIRKVFETFVKFGANENILYDYKPHIGTDILYKVVKKMKEEIIKYGGTFLFNSCLTNIICDNNKIKSIEINNKQTLDCEVLVLAIGHSARDTFKMLHDSSVEMRPKPFAIGLRVAHSQKLINEGQYGKYKNILPPASYKLTYKARNNRGVYSFCMCPGGYIVNASSEKGLLAVNGMSYSKRDSSSANSAIVVTVKPEDFGSNIFDGMNFQRQLESKAYIEGKSNIPIQLLKDFKLNKESYNLGNVKPTIKGKYSFGNLNNVLPSEISKSIIEAFKDFGKKIKGFDNDDTVLAGVESRTSSPICIIRDENLESNIRGIYPCGEGAGYAGGITSASVDGLKVFESIIKKYINK